MRMRGFNLIELLVVIMLIAILWGMVSGCVMGVAGARVNVPLPGSRQNMAMDSVNSQGSQGASEGQQVDGEAAVEDGERRARGAHQVMVSGDATNARSTDTGMADEASTVAGRETSGTVSPTQERAGSQIDVTAGGNAVRGELSRERDETDGEDQTE